MITLEIIFWLLTGVAGAVMYARKEGILTLRDIPAFIVFIVLGPVFVLAETMFWLGKKLDSVGDIVLWKRKP